MKRKNKLLQASIALLAIFTILIALQFSTILPPKAQHWVEAVLPIPLAVTGYILVTTILNSVSVIYKDTEKYNKEKPDEF